MLDIILLIAGMTLLLGGGDVLVRGASSLARNGGLSPGFVGLTVVAFGTSAPELSVNILAAVQGNGAVSFGNIIGSNIANSALILGCAALITPLRVQGTIISREIPMMLLASVAALVMASDVLLRDVPPFFDRTEGLLLLLFFGVFLYYSIGEVIGGKTSSDPLIEQAAILEQSRRLKSLFLNAMLVLAGLAGLITGARLTVDSAVHIARMVNIPEAVIGLTIVAVGTSLPELVTSGMAAWRGQNDLAVGNVVGSNIFNLLFVTGLSAAVAPIAVPPGGVTDLLVMTALAAILLPLSLTHKKQIVRGEGIFLLAVYCVYLLWRTA